MSIDAWPVITGFGSELAFFFSKMSSVDLVQDVASGFRVPGFRNYDTASKKYYR